ncbi:hypothetical protein [Pseudomonas sp.]|uniref:hypothetical protein n=1 Tax=Pseudomonas sp. TaxID=306 RepID=UPI002618C888|nr:hypothetical protein [Pseudomonas sp.]
MPSYQFTVVHTPLVDHEVVLKQARHVLDHFISTREHLVYSESIKDEATTEFSISDKDGAGTGKFFVMHNSALFMLYGPHAADDAWTAESDVVELMESAFPGSRMT